MTTIEIKIEKIKHGASLQDVIGEINEEVNPIEEDYDTLDFSDNNKIEWKGKYAYYTINLNQTVK